MQELKFEPGAELTEGTVIARQHIGFLFGDVAAAVRRDRERQVAGRQHPAWHPRRLRRAPARLHDAGLSGRGRRADAFDRTIDVQVSRLRRKLVVSGDDPDIIKTVRGAGYMFAPRALTPSP
ncbi:MAG: hypothetical protein HC794_03770 [Nitrospiraceae bacterium]|nr:hypothetical protein [Nitrospiraceae bacterium]